MVNNLVPTAAEQRLIDAVACGSLCDLASPDGKGDRTIRADLIYALCVKGSDDCAVHPKGIRLRSATITGQLDFESHHICHPLTLERCTIESPIILSNATVMSLNLSGCRVPRLEADGLTTDGDVDLSDLEAKGGVSVAAAQIGGNLVTRGASLGSTNGVSLDATNAVVRLDCYLSAVPHVRLGTTEDENS